MGNLLVGFYEASQLYGKAIGYLTPSFRFDLNFTVAQACPFCGHPHSAGFIGSWGQWRRLGVVVCGGCGLIHGGY